MNDGLARPLDSLVAKHGGDLAKRADHRRRQDHGGRLHGERAAPVLPQGRSRCRRCRRAATYEEVLAAAEAIKSKGLMDYPIAGTYKAGWNLGEEFVNMYLGHGGSFFKAASAEPAINNAKGVATEHDEGADRLHEPGLPGITERRLALEWEAGNAALTNLWGLRAGAVTDGARDRRNREQHHRRFRADRCRRLDLPPPPLMGKRLHRGDQHLR